jgi:hypothetical protein
MWLFRASTPVVVLVVAAWVFGATAVGMLVGRRLRRTHADLREPAAVLQAALFGFVALLLAFGLSMAVERYEGRRRAVVEEANAIGTAYLRAQLLAEPARSRSLVALREYADARVTVSDAVIGTRRSDDAVDRSREIQRALWAEAGAAVADRPVDSVPRLYVEALNEMIDLDTARLAILGNRIPTTVLNLQILGAALAMGVLGFQLGLMDRGTPTAVVAAGLVVVMLLAIIDLDRPRRGLVTVPNGPLTAVRASMDAEPASGGPVRG